MTRLFTWRSQRRISWSMIAFRLTDLKDILKLFQNEQDSENCTPDGHQGFKTPEMLIVFKLFQEIIQELTHHCDRFSSHNISYLATQHLSDYIDISYLATQHLSDYTALRHIEDKLFSISYTERRPAPQSHIHALIWGREIKLNIFEESVFIAGSFVEAKLPVLKLNQKKSGQFAVGWNTYAKKYS